MRDVLLFDLSTLSNKVSSILKMEVMDNLVAIFILSLLFCVVTDFDFGGVLKRLFQAFLISSVFASVFTTSADIGMSIGDKIIPKKSHFFNDFKFFGHKTFEESYQIRIKEKNEKNIEDKKSIWQKAKSAVSSAVIGTAVSSIDGFAEIFLWIISNFALWSVKATFTLGYYCPLMLCCLLSFLNVFPVLKKINDGLLISIFWIFLTPIVVAIIIAILEAVTVGDGLSTDISFLGRTLLGFMMSLYLLGSFTISYMLLKGEGISSAMSQTAQSFTAGLVASAGSFMFSQARSKAMSLGALTFFNKNGTKPLQTLKTGLSNSLLGKTVGVTKGFVSDKASQVLENRELIEKEKSLTGYSKGSATPKRDKVLVAANWALNPVKAFSQNKEHKARVGEISKSSYPSVELRGTDFDKSPVKESSRTNFVQRGNIGNSLMDSDRSIQKNVNGKRPDFNPKQSRGTYRNNDDYLNNLTHDHQNNFLKKDKKIGDKEKTYRPGGHEL